MTSSEPPTRESKRPQGRQVTNRRLPLRPASRLAERWTTIAGIDVFYRESPDPPRASVMMHVPGFGLSGRYLLPTAEALMDEFHTLVPDLPGFGRSGKAAVRLDVPQLAQAAAAFLDRQGIEKATLVGNSMGCPVICEFAHLYPGRLERAILVAPAGGLHNQPLSRAVRQILNDGTREPPELLRLVVPDYLRFGVPNTFRLFRALTRYPTLRRLLDLNVPTLAVVGNRDPLLPPPARVREFAELKEHRTLFVVIDGAAHAINFSHPGELANVIRLFMADQPIVDDPNSRGTAKVYELCRGIEPSANRHVAMRSRGVPSTPGQHAGAYARTRSAPDGNSLMAPRCHLRRSRTRRRGSAEAVRVTVSSETAVDTINK